MLSRTYQSRFASQTLVKPCFASQVGAARGYPGAAQLKILNRRRGTVNQIGKITNTMKVVASSKFPGAQVAANVRAPFFDSMQTGPIVELTNKLRENQQERQVLTVVIYTDKGLCGSTNNQITRMLEKEDLSNQKFVVWGEKGSAAFAKSSAATKVIFSAHPSGKSPLTFAEAANVVEDALKQEFELIRIIYNKMHGSMSSEIEQIWLPSLSSLNTEDAREFLTPYEVEATAADELLASLNEFQFCSALSYAHYQNQAVELFQRRNSMENASKNAKEVSKKLTILYNKARQALITTELGEIVSGAAAVDEMIKKK